MFYFYAHFLKWNEREFIKNFYKIFKMKKDVRIKYLKKQS